MTGEEDGEEEGKARKDEPQAQEMEVFVPAESISSSAAERFHGSYDRAAALKVASAEMRSHGMLAAVACLENEIAKERRRMRALCSEHPAVAGALEQRKEREEAEARRKRRDLDDEHKHELSAKRLKAEFEESNKALKKKQAQLRELEGVLEAKYAMKTFTPELLGQGQLRSGGPSARKSRFEVLDRLAHLGVGLSPAQKNDWTWFKGAWDAKMVNEHEQEWGSTFAGWIQRVLEDMEEQAGSNAFSEFVHDETIRCLSDAPALRLPHRKK
jgi:hypothetical protein